MALISRMTSCCSLPQTHWLLLLRKYPQTHLWTLTPTLTLPPQGSGLMLAHSCTRTTSRRGIHCRLWQVSAFSQLGGITEPNSFYCCLLVLWHHSVHLLPLPCRAACSSDIRKSKFYDQPIFWDFSGGQKEASKPHTLSWL